MNDYLCFRTKEDTSEVRAIKQQGMFFSTFYPEPRKKGMPRAIVIATYCLVFSFKEPNLLLLSWFSRVWLCGPHRQQPTRLPRPWDSPGKNIGVGCHFLFLVFPILLFSSISLHWSLRKALLSLLVTLWNSAFKWVYLSFSPLLFPFFFSQLFERPPQIAILLLCISFPWGWSWSLSPAQCHEPPSIVHQTLSIRSSPLNLFLTSTV